jgi:hypothetical protein
VRKYASVLLGALCSLTVATNALAVLTLDIPEIDLSPPSASARQVDVPVLLRYDPATDLPLNIDAFDISVSVTTPVGAPALKYLSLTSLLPPAFVVPPPAGQDVVNGTPLTVTAATFPPNGVPLSNATNNVALVTYRFEVPGSTTGYTYAFNFTGTQSVTGDRDGTVATITEFFPTTSGGYVATPEPGSLSILGLAMLAGLRRHRRAA